MSSTTLLYELASTKLEMDLINWLLEKYAKISRDIVVLSPVPYKKLPKLLCAADIGVVSLSDVEQWRYQTLTKLVEMISMRVSVIATPLPSIEMDFERLRMQNYYREDR